MNITELQKKLLSAARVNPPGDQVPYAFEKRVTALISARGTADHLAAWVRGLWRAAMSCVVIALVLGVWVVYSPGTPQKSDDLSQNLATTLLASVDQNDQGQ